MVGFGRLFMGRVGQKTVRRSNAVKKRGKTRFF